MGERRGKYIFRRKVYDSGKRKLWIWGKYIFRRLECMIQEKGASGYEGKEGGRNSV
jgi:hypothetical protein